MGDICLGSIGLVIGKATCAERILDFAKFCHSCCCFFEVVEISECLCVDSGGDDIHCALCREGVFVRFQRYTASGLKHHCFGLETPLLRT